MIILFVMFVVTITTLSSSFYFTLFQGGELCCIQTQLGHPIILFETTIKYVISLLQYNN